MNLPRMEKSLEINLCPLSTLEDVPPAALQTPEGGDEDFSDIRRFCPGTWLSGVLAKLLTQPDKNLLQGLYNNIPLLSIPAL